MDALPPMLTSPGPAERVSRRVRGLTRARRRRAALNRVRDRSERLLPAAPALCGGFALAYFLDPANGRGRRKLAVQRVGGVVRRGARRGERATRHVTSEAAGAAHRMTHPQWAQSPPPDDITLARKVETVIFRPADAPKGTVNVNAVDGVVYLRGTARTPDEISELESKVCAIPGVRRVENLLHLPHTPVPADHGGARSG